MGKIIISLFPHNTQYIDFKFFLLEQSTFFIVVIAFALLLFGIVFTHFYKRFAVVARAKKQKLSPVNSKKKIARKNTFDFIKTKENFEYKFIWSNEFLGIKTKETYYIIKFLSVSVCLLLSFEIYLVYVMSFVQLVLLTLVGVVLGWKAIDFILWQEKKSREKSIKENMPMLLISFDNYAKSGLVFDDILTIVPQFISGPLQKEFVRFSVSYMVSKDFEKCIKEFSKRLGCDEGEEIELKLRQIYYSGIYEDMLTNEKELIERKVINDIKKESGMFELYMALAMCLMLVNIFILSIIPLMTIAQQNLAGIM